MTTTETALRWTKKAGAGTVFVAVWTAKKTWKLSSRAASASAKAIQDWDQNRRWEAARAKPLAAPGSTMNFATLNKNARLVGPPPTRVAVTTFATTSEGHVEYTIETETANGSFTSRHRYSDFARLAKELSASSVGYSGGFPPKLLFHGGGATSERMAKLQAWLSGALGHPNARESPALHAFLGLQLLALNL